MDRGFTRSGHLTIVTRTNWYFYVHYALVLNKFPADLSYEYNRVNIPHPSL